jgi:hypothetical protein
MERYITRGLQERFLRVGGGDLVNPGVNGRGKKWKLGDLDWWDLIEKLPSRLKVPVLRKKQYPRWVLL